MILYSIIIPINNGIHFTERCIISLLDDLEKENIDIDKVEILLIDDSSEDGIYELLENYKELNIKIIKAPKGSSYSIKNNLASRLSNGKYLILLNNDTEILENLIKPMEKILSAMNNVGIVSNKHYFPNLKTNHLGIAFQRDRTPVHMYPNEEDIYPFLFVNRIVPAVTAACLMVRRSEFIKIGGFDEKYIYGYEDVDLCLKYRKELSLSCFITTESKIIHFGQSTYGRESYEDINRKYFQEKWKSMDFSPYIDQIYKKDKYKLIKKIYSINHDLENSKLYKETEVPSDNNSDLIEIVLFLDSKFSSFNLVIQNIVHQLEVKYPKKYKITQDIPENFDKYYDKDCYTITWTHFWPQYFFRTRKNPNKDFRLFAVNYERNADYIDYWSHHIIENDFQILAISEYCKEFLVKIGVNNNRISVLSLAFNNLIKPKSKELLKSTIPTYLIFANSNDPDRYGAELAIMAFSEAFRNNKNDVKLVFKDYGSNKKYYKLFIDEYLKGFKIEYVNKFLSDEELSKLYQNSYCLISPFRGEGFGMKIIDAAATGLLIICPFYGGPKDYLQESSFLPLDFHLDKISDNTIDKEELLLDDSYIDCKVDKDSLVRQLKYSLENYEKLANQSLDKSKYIQKNYSWQNVVVNLDKILSKKNLLKSEKLKNKYEVNLITAINKIENPDVSVIINTYERPLFLEKLLNKYSNLKDLSYYKVEFVIIDDGSKVDYLDIINKFKASDLHIYYYKYKDNRGMTYSKNVGIYKARGKIGIFTGDDIYPINGFISRRIKIHEEEGKKVLVLGHTEWAPQIRNNIIAEFSTKYSGFQFNYEEFRNEKEIHLRNLYTSNVSFNLSEIKEKNLYFEEIDGLKFFEDNLWGEVLSRLGYKLIYERKIEALHDHPIDYNWFVKRSEMVGYTYARLHLKYPGLLDRDEILEKIKFFRTNLKSQGKTGDINIISPEIDNYLKSQFLILEKLTKDSKNYFDKMKVAKYTHKLLSRINLYYYYLGILNYLGLSKKFQFLLFELTLEDGYNSNNVNMEVNKLLMLRNRTLIKYFIKAIINYTSAIVNNGKKKKIIEYLLKNL